MAMSSSFKKFRHSLGRFLGIRKYVSILEPGQTVDLDKLLGKLDGPSPEKIYNKKHEDLENASFLKLPVVTMSNFGRSGRFGNQLFQYAFLRLVARRQGAVLHLPLWAGTALFNLDETNNSCPTARAINEKDTEEVEIAKLFQVQSPGFINTDFNGYFMMHTRYYAVEKDFIRECFTFDCRVRSLFESALNKLGLSKKKIIAIHLRRGDYGYGQFFRAPCSWYQQWIKEMNYSPNEYIVYICSEAPQKYRSRFPGFTVITADDLRCPLSLAPYFDFLAMTLADAVAISNSSFSFFASMLNKNATKFFRPDFDKTGLVQFEPWNAEPLIEKKLSPGQHKYLKSID